MRGVPHLTLCPAPLLSVRGLCIQAGRRNLVEDLSFEVRPGERVCLLGASGSGKSLTASALLGLLPPALRLTGQIMVSGIDVTGVPAPLRPVTARLGMVFQDSHSALNPLVTILSQLQQPLRRWQGLSAAAARRQAMELLRAMGLPDPEAIGQRCPPELSGGQRQRVCIALAIACRTALLVADEPTTALDVITQAQVLQVLKDNTEGPGAPALLFITHDLAAASQLCHRAIIIEQGALVEAGDLGAILAAPRHPYTRALIAAAQDGRIEASGSLAQRVPDPAGC